MIPSKLVGKNCSNENACYMRSLECVGVFWMCVCVCVCALGELERKLFWQNNFQHLNASLEGFFLKQFRLKAKIETLSFRLLNSVKYTEIILNKIYMQINEQTNFRPSLGFNKKRCCHSNANWILNWSLAKNESNNQIVLIESSFLLYWINVKGCQLNSTRFALFHIEIRVLQTVVKFAER